MIPPRAIARATTLAAITAAPFISMSEGQKSTALATLDVYQKALTDAGFGKITTEILPLKNYITAEKYHQDYLKKNPDGDCGLGGTGVKYPGYELKVARTGAATAVSGAAMSISDEPLNGGNLNLARQLVVFEAENCGLQAIQRGNIQPMASGCSGCCHHDKQSALWLDTGKTLVRRTYHRHVRKR